MEGADADRDGAALGFRGEERPVRVAPGHPGTARGRLEPRRLAPLPALHLPHGCQQGGVGRGRRLERGFPPLGERHGAAGRPREHEAVADTFEPHARRLSVVLDAPLAAQHPLPSHRLAHDHRRRPGGELVTPPRRYGAAADRRPVELRLGHHDGAERARAHQLEPPRPHPADLAACHRGGERAPARERRLASQPDLGEQRSVRRDGEARRAGVDDDALIALGHAELDRAFGSGEPRGRHQPVRGASRGAHGGGEGHPEPLHRPQSVRHGPPREDAHLGGHLPPLPVHHGQPLGALQAQARGQRDPARRHLGVAAHAGRLAHLERDGEPRRHDGARRVLPRPALGVGGGALDGPCAATQRQRGRNGGGDRAGERRARHASLRDAQRAAACGPMAVR